MSNLDRCIKSQLEDADVKFDASEAFFSMLPKALNPLSEAFNRQGIRAFVGAHGESLILLYLGPTVKRAAGGEFSTSIELSIEFSVDSHTLQAISIVRSSKTAFGETDKSPIVKETPMGIAGQLTADQVQSHILEDLSAMWSHWPRRLAQMTKHW